jgi:hypothetical protein
LVSWPFVLSVFTAFDYIIGILDIVLLIFTASDYIIGILAIVFFVFTASDYIIGILAIFLLVFVLSYVANVSYFFGMSIPVFSNDYLLFQ